MAEATHFIINGEIAMEIRKRVDNLIEGWCTHGAWTGYLDTKRSRFAVERYEHIEEFNDCEFRLCDYDEAANVAGHDGRGKPYMPKREPMDTDCDHDEIPY